MGTQKLLLPIDGIPMIDRVIAACSDFPTIIVCHPEVSKDPERSRGAVAKRPQIVINPHPELGMAHSLDLAHQSAPENHALLVFLADKPFVTAELAARIATEAQAQQADVCFPERGGIGGHPVYFSPKARQRIDGMTGDSLQRLRDDRALARVPLAISDPGAYTDIDDQEALTRARDE